MSTPDQLTQAVASAITTESGRITVSSRQVAEHFDKRHDHVVRDIRDIMAAEAEEARQGRDQLLERDGFSEGPYIQEDRRNFPSISEGKKDLLNFEEISTTPDFEESTYLDSYGREQVEFRLSRDGFTLLAMGFTGKEALRWKRAYIRAFNMMEATLNQQRATPLPDFTEFVQAHKRNISHMGDPHNDYVWLPHISDPTTTAVMRLNGRPVEVTPDGWMNVVQAVAAQLGRDVTLPKRRGPMPKSSDHHNHPDHVIHQYGKWLASVGSSLDEEVATGRLRWGEPDDPQEDNRMKPWICPERATDFLETFSPELHQQLLALLGKSAPRVLSKTITTTTAITYAP